MAGLLGRIGKVFWGPDPADGEQSETDRQAAGHRAAHAETWQQIRRGIARIAELRRGLANRLATQVGEIDRATDRARHALLQGRVTLAAEALRHKAVLGGQLATLESQHDRLRLTEERLVFASARLQARLDSLRAQRLDELSEPIRAELIAQIDASLGELADDVAAAVAQSVELAEATVLDEPDPQQARELDRQAARELAAMQAEQLTETAPAPTAGQYRQPGSGGAATRQDSFRAETDQEHR